MAEEEEVRDLLNSMRSRLWKNGLRGDRHRSWSPAIGTTASLSAADLSSLTPMLARYSAKRDPKEVESFVPCDSSRH